MVSCHLPFFALGVVEPRYSWQTHRPKAAVDVKEAYATKWDQQVEEFRRDHDSFIRMEKAKGGGLEGRR